MPTTLNFCERSAEEKEAHTREFNQKVEANYLENYHAISDTFDKVDFAQLKKNEAMAAELLIQIANAPQRIGPRWTRAQIATSITETHLDDQMKGFGMWDDWVSGKRGRKP